MTAMAEALAKIERAFSPAARIQMRKNHIRQIMRLSPAHPEIWRRYQRLAERYPTCSLPVAIFLVNCMHRYELHSRDVALRVWGRVSRPRVALMLVTEARIILRWMRRYDPRVFDGVRDIIVHPELAEAAQ